jgi:hypothetical protein
VNSPRHPAIHGSLWTTPAPADTTPLAATAPDPAATRERMREAVATANRRADELAGRISDELLGKIV